MDERIRSTPPAIATTAARAAHKAIQRIAQRAVPALADFAMVFIVAGRTIVGIASAHATPAGARLLRDLQRVYRIRRDDVHSTVAQVIRTGRPSLRRSIHHERTSRPPRASVDDLHHRLTWRPPRRLPTPGGPI